MIDFDGVKAYVYERLNKELPLELTYHNLWHTRDEVVPAALHLAQLEKIDLEDTLLIATAACFHDLGFTVQVENHELASMHIAGQVLPDFGYSAGDIQAIKSLILATRMPQHPHGPAAAILVDADLESLGRDYYLTRNQALRNEIGFLGRFFSDEEWYANQLEFLNSHRYFTASAQRIHAAQKQSNILALAGLLDEARGLVNPFKVDPA